MSLKEPKKSRRSDSEVDSYGSVSDTDSNSSDASDRNRKRKRAKDKKRSDKKDKRRRRYSSGSESDESGDRDRKKKDRKKHKKKSSRSNDSGSESPREENYNHSSKGERFTTDSDEDKRMRKEKKKVEKVAKALGYTNDLNPFGDANLLTPFEWGKKKSVTNSGNNKEEEEKGRLKLMTEIEKVRKRRLDREAELAEMERLRDEEQRLREVAAFGDWQHKEEEFHLEQTMERARLRLLDRRDRPLDRCIKNFIMIQAAEKLIKFNPTNQDASHKEYELKELAKEISLLKLSTELENPVEIVEKLDAGKLQDVADELDVHQRLDREKGDNRMEHFWASLKTIVDARLKRMREANHGQSSFHSSVSNDVEALLHGKSENDLNYLEADIRNNLEPGKVVDVEYWELMLYEVVLQRAKAAIAKKHIEMIQELQTLYGQIKDTGILREDHHHKHHHHDRDGHHHHHHHHHHRDHSDSRDDKAVRNYLRDVAHDNDEELGETELKMSDADEIQLSEADATGGETWWQDKYRPRKPRYFNRVRTGWDRNKYNLTHYDSDNPPPVRIQGYKFTIFYPDLIDKTKTPRYFIEPCPDNNEFVIIRFHAGPPYEDIAFKIVNREWDTHRRSGFQTVFDHGILRLNFSFKRAFYRR
jgi:hypothetical protein